MKQASLIGGFNIFSTNGAFPPGVSAAQCGLPVMALGRADHARASGLKLESLGIPIFIEQ
jgi:hypothetical protein